tara:strand:- start:180 stop:368 length:189 start_codon:yes stop_codon:yes gene_type:complete
MAVIIKVDTGFVGATHECETDLSVDEWNALTNKERNDWKLEVIHDYIDVFAVDEDDVDTELN